ncbi:MAG TPA: hypothetical protein VFJ72_09530 [Rubrobacteraceae bacterium]|nr:hypothetical protein [Rubrobacteraceae bacterium]
MRDRNLVFVPIRIGIAAAADGAWARMPDKVGVRKLYRVFRANQPIFVGVGLAVLYWIAESALDVLMAGTGTFAGRLPPVEDANELWMRAIIVSLILGFGFYSKAQRPADG